MPIPDELAVEVCEKVLGWVRIPAHHALMATAGWTNEDGEFIRAHPVDFARPENF